MSRYTTVSVSPDGVPVQQWVLMKERNTQSLKSSTASTSFSAIYFSSGLYGRGSNQMRVGASLLNWFASFYMPLVYWRHTSKGLHSSLIVSHRRSTAVIIMILSFSRHILKYWHLKVCLSTSWSVAIEFITTVYQKIKIRNVILLMKLQLLSLFMKLSPTAQLATFN